MASEKSVKTYAVEFAGPELTDIGNAMVVFIAQVERAIAKETDQDVVAIRMKQVQRLTALKNRVLYGGKELV